MIVVIPMAGRGRRFSDVGYETPKPLIEVAGKPMVLWALESLQGLSIRKIIFVALREHEEKYQIKETLKGYNGLVTEFIFLNKVTEGQLCTVLEAREHFDDEEDVLIAASDSYIKSDLAHEIEASVSYAGLISVISLPGDQWSFVKTDREGKVIEVAEKIRISDNCSTGLYYFSKCKYLTDYGDEIINNNERTRNEFYIIPVYQKMITAGLEIGLSVAREMWDMGNPKAKELFEKYRHS